MYIIPNRIMAEHPDIEKMARALCSGDPDQIIEPDPRSTTRWEPQPAWRFKLPEAERAWAFILDCIEADVSDLSFKAAILVYTQFKRRELGLK